MTASQIQGPRTPQLPAAGGPARVPVGVASVPCFSPIAIHLLDAVSRENVALHELAELVRADPGMSVEVLRLVNSSLFGACREVTGILHAVAMLGLKRLSSLVMTVALRDFLAPVRQAAVFAPCWRHCLATAFIAERIAGECSDDPDEAYTGGLLHELGQLGLIAAHSGAYDALVIRSRQEAREVGELEREYFGIDSQTMGLKMVERWGLPENFRSFVACAGASNGPAAIVETACRLAGLFGFRVTGGDEHFERTRFPGLPPGFLETVEEADRLLTDVATKINMLECSLVMI